MKTSTRDTGEERSLRTKVTHKNSGTHCPILWDRIAAVGDYQVPYS